MRANPNVVIRGDRNECAACGVLFNSSAAFDKHRVGYFHEPSKRIPFPRRCMAEVEMRAAGMSINNDGFWITKEMPESRLDKRRTEVSFEE